MQVHPELRELFERIAGAPPECCRAGRDGGECGNWHACTLVPACGAPCRHCGCWAGRELELLDFRAWVRQQLAET
jgi:hypothetical protein